MMAMAAVCPVKVAGSPYSAARHHQALLSTNNNLRTLKSAASRPPVKPRNAIAQGCRVMCMQVWPPVGIRKYETLSYLKPLSEESVLKEIDYIVSKGWIPCLEFDCEGQIHRTNSRIPGYYDGRYWTLWKLPMFGCTDSAQVMREINECKKAYPNAYIRCLGFDNKRQTQCIAFVVYRPSASA